MDRNAQDPAAAGRLDTDALLDVETLFETAAAQAGHPIDDAEALKPHVRRHVEALTDEAHLSPTGRMLQGAKLLGLLVNRARFDADLAAHPEIRDERLADPIIIVGLPRTGTTKLMRTLATDPALEALPYWWLANPAPLGEAAPGKADPRIETAESSVAMLKQMFPEFVAAHPTEASAPDEEVFAQELTFESMVCALNLYAPAYQERMREHPQDEAYRYLHLLLRYHQWQFPDSRGKPLVLKSPMHLRYLPLLLEHFPRATVVHCRRDVTVSIPSLCRLFETIWGMNSDELDPVRVGELVTGYWAAAAAEHLRHRSSLPVGTTLLDVDFDDIIRRPLDVLERIYTAHGLSLTNGEQMLAGEAAHPRDRYGAHEYSLKRYGLDADSVRELFAGYCSPTTV